MKSIIGVSLIIVGILIIVFAFEQFANTECHCPVQIVGQSENCPCAIRGMNLVYSISYGGLAITGVGIAIFIIDNFKNKQTKLDN